MNNDKNTSNTTSPANTFTPFPVTPPTFSDVIQGIEEIQRTQAALRGAAVGIHHSIDNREASGYEVEALFTVIAKVLDQQANDLIDRVTQLMEEKA